MEMTEENGEAAEKGKFRPKTGFYVAESAEDVEAIKQALDERDESLKVDSEDIPDWMWNPRLEAEKLGDDRVETLLSVMHKNSQIQRYLDEEYSGIVRQKDVIAFWKVIGERRIGNVRVHRLRVLKALDDPRKLTEPTCLACFKGHWEVNLVQMGSRSGMCRDCISGIEDKIRSFYDDPNVRFVK